MNLFELFVRIGVDDQASDKLSKLSSSLGKGLATAAKIGTAAVTGAGAAIVALTKASIDSYSEYEQLAGGAKLLWGDAYDFVADKAAGAYATVQMSQNEYLAQVNAFSTGLKTALAGNEKEAAILADRIITAQADIVAATGASRESVENAFNGIMKSNYTMLDNLQLGITPTKNGFQEIIDIVNKWNAEQGKATNYQIDNLADAQSALLDYIEIQGMSGYAAMEASGTISGSIASVKSAWSNLITGLSDDNANIDELISNFTETVRTASDNLIPIISKALFGAVDLFDKLVPRLIEEMPSTISELAPKIVEIGMNIITMLADGFTNNQVDIAGGVSNTINFLIETFIKLIPKIVEVGMTLVFQLVVGLISAIPQLVMAVPQLIDALISGMIDASDKFAQQGTEFVDAIMEGILKAWGNFKTWFNNLWDSFFSQRTVDVTVNTNGSHAGGLPYVPFDGYVAELHKGERVLTASEARQYNKGFNGNGSGITIVQNIQAVPQTPVEFASATAAYFEQARWAMA